MSKPIERPKEPGNKGKPIIHWIHTLWQRVTGHGTPERAETPEESPGGEYNKASVIPHPYMTKSDVLYLRIQRFIGDSRHGHYLVHLPVQVGNTGLWSSLGEMQFNNTHEEQRHAEEMLTDASTIFKDAARRLGRTITLTEYAEHPHPADVLRRLGFTIRENTQAGCDYKREFTAAGPRASLRPDQQQAVTDIVRFVKDTQSQRRPKR